MYTLGGYGEMIADQIRTRAYMAALRTVMRPGAIVMDIGTGPGMMAILACQLGASRVFAIESSEVVEIARETAVENHCAEKIEFYEGFSTEVTLPVRADVIVSDLRGVLPLFEHHIPSIADARRRFLAPGGSLIARMDRIWAAVVEAPLVYGKIIDRWDQNVLGQSLQIARRKVLNEFRKARLTPDQLLTEPRLWATLDYTSIENPDVKGTLQWTAERNGTAHGFLVWFDMDLAEGVRFSTGPESPETVYGAAFFPWLEPVQLVCGQSLCVDLGAKFLEGDYFWRWQTNIEGLGKQTTVRFDQSRLHGAVISKAKLRRSASDFVPQLSAEGRIRQRVVELIDGRASLEEIAQQLAVEFPERFSHWHKALPYAATISEEFSR
jgi:type I protein arginine methyltransferase